MQEACQSAMFAGFDVLTLSSRILVRVFGAVAWLLSFRVFDLGVTYG